MKKKDQNKKLSLKKLQLMKLNNMNIIHGGNADLGLEYNTGGDEPPTPIRVTIKPYK